MASTIEVVIQGIILLTSPAVYDGIASAKIGAAIAIRADGRSGKYDVKLPRHQAKLWIDTIAVAEPVPSVLQQSEGAARYHVDLSGQRIQFGTVVNGGCDPMPGGGAANMLLNDRVPDLTQLKLPSTKVADNARPTRLGDYSKIDTRLVRAWFNIADGELDVISNDPEIHAEFRPSLYPYSAPAGVKWTLSNVANPCMLITSFGGTDSVVWFEDGPIHISFENLPPPAALGHSHGRRGASYDFELFYDVLAAQPSVPPVPHYKLPDPMQATSDEIAVCIIHSCLRPNPTPTASGDPVSGVNCGPGKNPDPGNPPPP